MKMILHAATLTLVALAATSAAAQSLIGCDFKGHLYDVNFATGAATNPRTTQIDTLSGISFGPDGTLYGLTALGSNFPNALLSFNPSNGGSNIIGYTGLRIAEGDLDFDPSTGVLYGIENLPASGGRELFTIDTSTGVATVVGNVDTKGDLSAMAFDANGSLFILDTSTSSNRLLLVDKSTATIISSVNLRFSHDLAGMDFNPSTGVLYVAYGIPFDNVGGPGSLYTLNTTTGALTLVGSTHLSRGLSGLAFFTVPEPSNLVLISFTSFALLLMQRCCRRSLFEVAKNTICTSVQNML
jgi:hypothetical protein